MEHPAGLDDAAPAVSIPAMEPIGFILAIVAIAVVGRLLAGSMDGDRIERYVRQRGGRILTRQWAPFGRGWFGERNDRIYEIEYEDRNGDRRRATVKTSLWSGVYLTDDQIIRRGLARTAAEKAGTDGDDDTGESHDETAQLRAENARLKAELARQRRSPR
jgi:hypothetical protein